MQGHVLVTAFPQRVLFIRVFLRWVQRAAWPEGHLWGPWLPREEGKVSLCQDA